MQRMTSILCTLMLSLALATLAAADVYRWGWLQWLVSLPKHGEHGWTKGRTRFVPYERKAALYFSIRKPDGERF